jgi:predicted PurR-regulated permease PerM
MFFVTIYGAIGLLIYLYFLAVVQSLRQQFTEIIQQGENIYLKGFQYNFQQMNEHQANTNGYEHSVVRLDSYGQPFIPSNPQPGSSYSTAFKYQYTPNY